jgi:polyhydroxybutyrate depolymerase
MCCGYARDQRVDDIAFLAALIARLKGEFGADGRRVYLAGFSNGAMLASRFVLERHGVAAALVSVAGYLPCDAERPSVPLPVLVIHGDRDGIARYAPTPAHPATGRYCEDYPAKAQVDFWVRGFGLPERGQVKDARRSPARLEEYGPAKAGGRGYVRYVVVRGGGHAWPGGPRERFRYCDLPVPGVDATGLVLDFLRRAQAPQAAVHPPAAPAPTKARAKAKKKR